MDEIQLQPTVTPISSASPVVPTSKPKSHAVLLIATGAVILTIGIGIGLVLGKYSPKQIISYEECMKAKGSRVQESNPPTCVTANGLSFKGPVSSPTFTPDPTANWKTYSDKAKGVSFQYPGNWYVNSTPSDYISLVINSKLINFTGPHDGPNGDIEISPNICTNTITNEKSPCDSSITERSQKIRAQYTSESLKQINIAIGGRQGIETSGVLGPGFMQGTYIKEVAIPWNGYLLLFTVYDRKNEMIFDNILSTFKFVDQVAPGPTCKPRPACLDATPRCMIPETSDMCPPNQKL